MITDSEFTLLGS